MKIIALFGKSGSGKNYILDQILSDFPQLNLIHQVTTRPKREGESANDYEFIDTETFTKLLTDAALIEGSIFNNWCYGTKRADLSEDKINIGIFNVYAIQQMLSDETLEIYPILISCDDKTRLIRNLEREETPDCFEICRRFLEDRKDLMYIPFEYYEHFNCGYNIIELKKYIETEVIGSST